MERKTFLFTSLMASIVTLIYLFLVHYGVFRYISLHRNSTELYVKEYAKLPQGDTNRVVVVFPLDIKNMEKLRPFINSILDQTVRVDDIIASLPYSDIASIPADLRKLLTVRGYSKDYDDAGTLINSVLSEPEENTKIILVEPYRVYPQDFIQAIIEKSSDNPRKVVKTKCGKCTLVKPAFFDEKLSEYKKGSGCEVWLKTCCSAGEILADV
jgi:hypothetical protein